MGKKSYKKSQPEYKETSPKQMKRWMELEKEMQLTLSRQENKDISDMVEKALSSSPNKRNTTSNSPTKTENK